MCSTLHSIQEPALETRAREGKDRKRDEEMEGRSLLRELLQDLELHVHSAHQDMIGVDKLRGASCQEAFSL